MRGLICAFEQETCKAAMDEGGRLPYTFHGMYALHSSSVVFRTDATTGTAVDTMKIGELTEIPNAVRFIR